MGARIAIVGTGAVGGYAGAHMAQSGEDVTFVDFWPENVETIRAKGLRISHLRDVPETLGKGDLLLGRDDLVAEEDDKMLEPGGLYFPECFIVQAAQVDG